MGYGSWTAAAGAAASARAAAEYRRQYEAGKSGTGQLPWL